MKPILIVCLLLLTATATLAQQVVASSGNSGSISGYKIDWTLGEPVIETITGSTHKLTQGMHQTKLLATAICQQEVPGLEVKVYPNPTENMLKIEVIQTGNEHFQYELTDITGRKMLLRKSFFNTGEINMDNYVPGIYIIRVFNLKHGNEKVFKIIKN